MGNRLVFANGNIYYWQGAPSSWDCGGDAFYMFELMPLSIFDTGPGTYPGIFGMHKGTITPNQRIAVNKLYTYPCEGTGGHTEYVWIYGKGISESASWKGYSGDWNNLTFNNSFTLHADVEYNYTIRTGSYPQIHHNRTLTVSDGAITCTEFVDANGKRYNNWIPAIKLK